MVRTINGKDFINKKYADEIVVVLVIVVVEDETWIGDRILSLGFNAFPSCASFGRKFQ